LRAHADAALLISAHDERTPIAALLYQSAVQHMADLLFVLLCNGSRERLDQLNENLDRIQRLVDS
jgi:hypothetical protein